MRIKIWGCRGSLPAPGGETDKYGGNTTCVEIRLKDGTLIIIDAGSGIRKLGKALLKEKALNNIYLFLTHSHWDHLQGFPFFTPAYMPDYNIYVRGGPLAMQSLKEFLKYQMNPPYFPVSFDLLKAQFDFNYDNPEEQIIGCARIVPILLSHPNGGYGFKIIEESKTFVFLTDNELEYSHEGGLTEAEYINFCRGSNILFHDAQYTVEEYKITRGWGHSTFLAATRLSMAAEVNRFGIFHHDPDHTDEDLDRYILPCQELIDRENSEVECFGVQEGMELSI